MRAIWWLMLAATAACGDDPGDTPIPATPLAGELNGVAFTAGGATARQGSDPTERVIEIHPDAGYGCGDFGDEPYVAIVMPWTPGAEPLGFDSDATVFFFFDATAHLVLDGRLELDDAPTEPGATATLRVRASFVDRDDDLFVEGQVAVELCE